MLRDLTTELQHDGLYGVVSAKPTPRLTSLPTSPRCEEKVPRLCMEKSNKLTREPLQKSKTNLLLSVSNLVNLSERPLTLGTSVRVWVSLDSSLPFPPLSGINDQCVPACIKYDSEYDPMETVLAIIYNMNLTTDSLVVIHCLH